MSAVNVPPIGGRLTPTPESLRCGHGGPVHDHGHARAAAFCLLQGATVALAPRSTHTMIFNALRVVGAPNSAPDIERHRLDSGGAEAVYGNFGVQFYPAAPSKENLAWFVDNSVRELGQMRDLTLAGRAWRRIDIGGVPTDVLSWWVAKHLVSDTALRLVCGALGIAGACLVEFENSETPEVWAA